jgi:hypothetical protein
VWLCVVGYALCWPAAKFVCGHRSTAREATAICWKFAPGINESHTHENACSCKQCKHTRSVLDDNQASASEQKRSDSDTKLAIIQRKYLLHSK